MRETGGRMVRLPIRGRREPRTYRATIVAAGILTFGLSAAARAEYPERDIRVVVPWGAGGGTDGIVRKLTDLAEAEIGAAM